MPTLDGRMKLSCASLSVTLHSGVCSLFPSSSYSNCKIFIRALELSQDLKIDSAVLKKVCEQIRQEKYAQHTSIAKFKWSERYVARLGADYGLMATAAGERAPLRAAAMDATEPTKLSIR